MSHIASTLSLDTVTFSLGQNSQNHHPPDGTACSVIRHRLDSFCPPHQNKVKQEEVSLLIKNFRVQPLKCFLL